MSDQVGNPEARFSRVAAQIDIECTLTPEKKKKKKKKKTISGVIKQYGQIWIPLPLDHFKLRHVELRGASYSEVQYF